MLESGILGDSRGPEVQRSRGPESERGGAKIRDNAIMSPAAVTERLAVGTARGKVDNDRSSQRGSSHARSRLVDDLMEWRNVVIARPGSLVTTASGEKRCISHRT